MIFVAHWTSKKDIISPYECIVKLSKQELSQLGNMIKMHGVFLKIPKYLYNTTIQEDKFLFLLYNIKEIVRATTCDQS